MAYISCSHCEKPVETTVESLAEHVRTCVDSWVTRGEFQKTAKQVDEIHRFIRGLADAMNSPMLRAMLPADVRNMLG